MTTALERQVLAAPLIAYASANSLPVAWPNITFTPPQPPEAWVRFTVVDVKGQQIEMGSANNTHRVYGSLILQVFWPADEGDGDALALGDALGELYRQQIFNFPDTPFSGHVRMRDPNVREIGRDGAFWQVNVTIPFHRDDLL
jgi:hypothetical protein